MNTARFNAQISNNFFIPSVAFLVRTIMMRIFMLFIFPLSLGGLTLRLGLKKGKKHRERAFFPAPDSDRNGRSFYEHRVPPSSLKFSQYRKKPFLFANTEKEKSQ